MTENHYSFEEFRFSSTGIFYAFLMLFLFFLLLFSVLLLFIAFIRWGWVEVKGFTQPGKNKIVEVIFRW